MKLVDILIIAVVAAVVGLVIFYIRRAKKKGVHCIGCPDSGSCSGSCGHCSGNCGGCKMNQK